MTNAGRIISQLLLLIRTPKVGEAATIELQARGINTILLSLTVGGSEKPTIPTASTSVHQGRLHHATVGGYEKTLLSHHRKNRPAHFGCPTYPHCCSSRGCSFQGNHRHHAPCLCIAQSNLPHSLGSPRPQRSSCPKPP